MKILKKSFIYFLCTVLLITNISLFYFKPLKTQATEVVVASFAVEHVIYALLGAIASTLGICLTVESAPMLEDAYNDFSDWLTSHYMDAGLNDLDDNVGVVVDGVSQTVRMLIVMKTIMEMQQSNSNYEPPKTPKEIKDKIAGIPIALSAAFIGLCDEYMNYYYNYKLICNDLLSSTN